MARRGMMNFMQDESMVPLRRHPSAFSYTGAWVRMNRCKSYSSVASDLRCQYVMNCYPAITSR
jgi:hypothetical protein